MLEVKKGKKVARLNAATAGKPQEAPRRIGNGGWVPLKKAKKRQPALNLDDHALRAGGTVADI